MNNKENILVVEDDASLAEWICDYLLQNNYAVTLANSGSVAVDLIKSDKPDLVLLDIQLPELSGFEVCKKVRQYFHSPILMMTASGDEVDEVLGLELGADDYITKPVKPRVLLARIKALLRRNSDNEVEHRFCFGDLVIDAKSKSVMLSQEPVLVSSNEFDVLWLLASHAGKIMSRADLVSQLRGIDYDGFDRSIDIRISRLRKKMKDDPDNPKGIKTIWGKGYLFVADAWLRK